MRKTWLLGIVMLLLVKSASAVNQTIVGTNPFQYGVCPGDLFSLFLYFGMGAFLLVLVLLCKTLIRVPFITIFMGVGFMIWSSMGLWGCSMVFGLIGFMFGLGLIAYEFITTVVK